MKIVIIEDERLTAEDLKDLLLHVHQDTEVVSVLSSVKESIEYFKTMPPPDLIFSDIQLGDGLSFDIFQALDLSTPIIFCTAYNEYALNAFKTNGIHYILKPFDEKAIEDALKKYDDLKSSLGYSPQLARDLQALFDKNASASMASVLVYHQDRIIPVRTEEIALFYIKNGVTHLHTFDKETYFVNKTLDEIQQSIGNLFYRTNRQYIVNRNAVANISQRLSRKAVVVLKLPFPESIMISKEKITPFLNWLEGK